MNTGILSDVILKRSVEKPLSQVNNEYLNCKGAVIGDDCAFFSKCILLDDDSSLKSGINDLINTMSLDNSSARHRLILSAVLPTDFEEENLAEIMSKLAEYLKGHVVTVAIGDIRVAEVNVPVITILGYNTSDNSVIKNDMKSVMKKKSKDSNIFDLVMTKSIALEGTAIIAKEKYEELAKRFPQDLIESAKAFETQLSTVKEAKVAEKSGAAAMINLSEGGIYAALWNIGSKLGTGLKANLKLIPVRQETVEICNYYDINPYMLASVGSLLIATTNGSDMVRSLTEAGIDATVIGHTSEDNDRLILNNDEKKFLTRPQPDAMIKFRKEEKKKARRMAYEEKHRNKQDDAELIDN